jgi:ribosomal protein S18
MKTPKILERASRQYQHNNCSGLVPGFDYKETIKIVNVMTKALKAQSRLLTSYRVGSQPPEWVFDAIKTAREFGIEM